MSSEINRLELMEETHRWLLPFNQKQISHITKDNLELLLKFSQLTQMSRDTLSM